MKLTKIQTIGWKLPRIELDLYPVTMLRGRNGSGKTAVLHAVQWALSRRLPDPIGAKADRIWSLCNIEGDGQVLIRLETDSSVTVEVGLARRDGRVSVIGEPPDSLIIPSHILDWDEFMAKTASERAAILADAAGIEADAETIAEELRTLDVEGADPDGKLRANVADIWLHIAGERPTADALKVFVEQGTANLKSVRHTAETCSSRLNWMRSANPPRFVNAAELERVRQELQQAREAPEPEPPSPPDEREVHECDHQVRTLEKRLDQIHALTECPFCGPGAARGWKDNALRRHARLLTAARSELEKAISRLEQRRAEHEEATKRWKAARDERVSRITAAAARLAELEAESRHAETWQQIRESADRYEETLAGARRAEVVWQKAIRHIEARRREMVDGAGSRLMERARELSVEMLGGEITLANGELTLVRPNARISWRALSGTERMIAIAVLSASLASACRFKLVLMDEMGRMTRDNMELMLGIMRRLVQRGVIDQFIGAAADECTLAADDRTAR